MVGSSPLRPRVRRRAARRHLPRPAVRRADGVVVGGDRAADRRLAGASAGRDVVDLLPQVAIADAACIVLLPLVIDPDHVGRAALGAVVVLAGRRRALPGCCAAVERSGLRSRVHDVSEDRQFAVELRISLTVLFAMAALAVAVHVSLMLAGFVSGLAVAAVGEPRRVAKQLFAVTEGFFGPLFFVWLGARCSCGDLVDHPSMIVLGLGLGRRVPPSPTWSPSPLRQPAAYAMLATAQLGVPVAAATVGAQLDLLAARRGSRARAGRPGRPRGHRGRRLPRGPPPHAGAGRCLTSGL